MGTAISRPISRSTPTAGASGLFTRRLLRTGRESQRPALPGAESPLKKSPAPCTAELMNSGRQFHSMGGGASQRLLPGGEMLNAPSRRSGLGKAGLDFDRSCRRTGRAGLDRSRHRGRFADRSPS